VVRVIALVAQQHVILIVAVVAAHAEAVQAVAGAGRGGRRSSFHNLCLFLFFFFGCSVPRACSCSCSCACACVFLSRTASGFARGSGVGRERDLGLPSRGGPRSGEVRADVGALQVLVQGCLSLDLCAKNLGVGPAGLVFGFPAAGQAHILRIFQHGVAPDFALPAWNWFGRGQARCTRNGRLDVGLQ